MRILLKTVAIAAAVGLAAQPAFPCGDGWVPMNLVVTPRMKSGLRSAYLAAHPGLSPGAGRRPRPGRTYYGSYSATHYAVATFSVAGAPAYPTVFRTDARGRWHVRRQTHGGVCSDVVPVELIKVWWLRHSGGRCYVLPSSRTCGQDVALSQHLGQTQAVPDPAGADGSPVEGT